MNKITFSRECFKQLGQWPYSHSESFWYVLSTLKVLAIRLCRKLTKMKLACDILSSYYSVFTTKCLSAVGQG